MPRPGRIYLTLDVNYFDDPDIAELSDAAQLLDLRAMTLSKRLQSDGVLTPRQFQRLAPDSPPTRGATIGELVDRGIWIDKGDGLERRGWLAWNDSAESIAVMSRGGKHGNHIKHHVKGRKPPRADCEFCVNEGLVSPPTRPDSPPGRHTDADQTRPDADEYPTTLAAISSSSTRSLRAGAEFLEEKVATVEEARAELEAAGCDERTITMVLALLPNLKKAS